MKRISQSLTDPALNAAPYPFYDRLRQMGELVFWEEFDMPVASSHAAVSALLRDKKFGREGPRFDVPDYLEAFYAVEAHSMLELEPPRHTRLRKLVLHGFTSRRIKTLAPMIEQLATQKIDAFPQGNFDILEHFATPIPVLVIARLLGVPDSMADQLLRWSHAMVAMYVAGRTREIEEQAAQAATEFTEFMRSYINERRTTPANDLISELIAAEEDGDKLSTDEMITTCILLLNAGHEATVHSLGNGIKACLETGHVPNESTPIGPLVEEILRFDPPLHMFQRWAKCDVEVFGHDFKKGDAVGLLLGAANHDPNVYKDPHVFEPNRSGKVHTSFGGGIHFCVGAPLARLEMEIALGTLFQRCPKLRIAERPEYKPAYHFHGLSKLIVCAD